MTTIDLDPKLDIGVKCYSQIYIKSVCVYCNAKSILCISDGDILIRSPKIRK